MADTWCHAPLLCFMIPLLYLQHARLFVGYVQSYLRPALRGRQHYTVVPTGNITRLCQLAKPQTTCWRRLFPFNRSAGAGMLVTRARLCPDLLCVFFTSSYSFVRVLSAWEAQYRTSNDIETARECSAIELQTIADRRCTQLGLRRQVWDLITSTLPWKQHRYADVVWPIMPRTPTMASHRKPDIACFRVCHQRAADPPQLPRPHTYTAHT